MAGNTPADGNTKDVEIIVPLRYLSIFWRTLQMPLINCEVNFVLTWSSTCLITSSTGAGTFEIIETKLHVPVVKLSTQDNAKNLKSGFKRMINGNKYLSKPELLTQNPNLNHLVKTTFQGVNRHFVLAFEYDTQITSHSGYYLQSVETKDYNIMTDGKHFFDQSIKDNKTTSTKLEKLLQTKEMITQLLVN